MPPGAERAPSARTSCGPVGVPGCESARFVPSFCRTGDDQCQQCEHLTGISCSFRRIARFNGVSWGYSCSSLSPRSCNAGFISVSIEKLPKYKIYSNEGWRNIVPALLITLRKNINCAVNVIACRAKILSRFFFTTLSTLFFPCLKRKEEPFWWLSGSQIGRTIAFEGISMDSSSLRVDIFYNPLNARDYHHWSHGCPSADDRYFFL